MLLLEATRLDFAAALNHSVRVSEPAFSERELLTTLLAQVSRSFYLTLRVLPARVRTPIGLAYLLARTTDTIADTEIVPPAQRARALAALRDRILGQRAGPVEIGELARHQGLSAERLLLERVEDSLAVLDKMPAHDLQHLRKVLTTITAGQELDLRRFASASAKNIVALASDAALDEYTHLVAGCVGEFWTRICRAHLFPNARLDEARLLTDAVRFGKGLQLVNILRDLPADLRRGRCYLPEGGLSAAGLKPADLFDPANEKKLRPFYNRLLAIAESHLAAGWAYTNALPWRCARVRLACAWPTLIGVRTLARLRAGNPLDPRRPVKISRAEVRRLIATSVLVYPLPGLWRRLVPTPGAEVGKAVASSGEFI